jgi:hypothetical protein
LNSIGMGSNSGSIILNNSYIDDGSNKKWMKSEKNLFFNMNMFWNLISNF